MGDDKTKSLLNKLSKNKFAIGLIILAIALVIASATGVYFYKQSNARAAQIKQDQSNYAALNENYNALSGNYSALVTADNALNARFINLTNTYNGLSSNLTNSESAYQALNSSVSNFEETGGPAIALYYQTSNTGTTGQPNYTVNITAYNVGDETDSQFTVYCSVLFDGTPSQEQQTFSNVGPLDKRSVSWVFTPGTALNSVWVVQ
jgi:archaellum component FlaF (FlaF/FlaG flagellin family)